jgi:hypothetical protein
MSITPAPRPDQSNVKLVVGRIARGENSTGQSNKTNPRRRTGLYEIPSPNHTSLFHSHSPFTEVSVDVNQESQGLSLHGRRQEFQVKNASAKPSYGAFAWSEVLELSPLLWYYDDHGIQEQRLRE